MSSKLSCVFKCEAVSGKIMKLTEENLQQCREKLRKNSCCIKHEIQRYRFS